MRDLPIILDELYIGDERLSRDEIYRRAVAADVPTEMISWLDTLPEGEYAQDEAAEALAQIGAPEQSDEPAGVPGDQLADEDLLRELGELHRTRHDALRHGSDHALTRHTERLAELESEYLRRYPLREVDPERLRAGARARDGGTRRVENAR
ncbi:MAG: hypothetical protein QOI74_2910 [Micromonosporaceae bacterium]|jgi:hypothetical protein|nr:hypothetical protein [Micromonosporaceae bacterium]